MGKLGKQTEGSCVEISSLVLSLKRGGNVTVKLFNVASYVVVMINVIQVFVMELRSGRK